MPTIRPNPTAAIFHRVNSDGNFINVLIDSSFKIIDKLFMLTVCLRAYEK